MSTVALLIMMMISVAFPGRCLAQTGPLQWLRSCVGYGGSQSAPVPVNTSSSPEDHERGAMLDVPVPDATQASFVQLLESKHRVDPFRILLIGSSGAGKTAVLDLMSNLNLLAPNGIVLPQKQYDWRQITHIHRKHSERATVLGQPGTKDTNVYKIKVGKALIEVIDTPGFGDTSGILADKDNAKSVVNLLQHVKKINMVVLVCPPSTRANPQYAYVLSAIRGFIPKAVAKNVVAVYTFSRTRCVPRETSRLMREHHQYIDSHYCIDNPLAMFEDMEPKSDAELAQDDIDGLHVMLSRAVVTIGKILHSGVSKMPSVATAPFAALCTLRSALEEKLVSISNSLSMAASEKESLSIFKGQLEDIKARKVQRANTIFNDAYHEWVMVKLDHHTTVCNGVDEDGVACHCNCHPHCALRYTDTESEIFRYCAAFLVNPDHQCDPTKVHALPGGDGAWLSCEYCTKCGHDYKRHLHGMYKWEQVQRTNQVVSDVSNRLSTEADLQDGELLNELITVQQRIDVLDGKLSVDFQLLSRLISQFQDVSLSPNFESFLHHIEAVVVLNLQSDMVLDRAKDVLRQELLTVRSAIDVVANLKDRHIH